MRMLLGPILFIQDVAWQNQATGIALCLLLIPCMLIPFYKTRWWSMALAALATIGWLLTGIVGEGIDV